MPKFRDLTGQRFGRLLVLSQAEKTNKAIRWRCVCSCGRECTVQANHLISGAIKSCGCLCTEARITHGMSKTKIFRTWKNMKDRCLNPNVPKYKNHGGRGIKVCDEWLHDFAAFYEHVSKLAHFGEEGYTLDRIDNDGDYCPGNVRWATAKEQNRNLRTNHLVEYNGQLMPIGQAAELSGIKADILRTRIHRHGDKYDKLFCADKMQGGSEKIPDSTRAQILAWYQPNVRGHGATATAKKFGVSKRSVFNIVKTTTGGNP